MQINYRTASPAPPVPTPCEVSPVPASVPDAYPWSYPPKAEVLDPFVHARCVVEVAAMGVTWQPDDLPDTYSPHCGHSWPIDFQGHALWVSCTLFPEHVDHEHLAIAPGDVVVASAPVRLRAVAA